MLGRIKVPYNMSYEKVSDVLVAKRSMLFAQGVPWDVFI